MNNGEKNEYDFVLIFNNKKISELDLISYNLIHSIYRDIDDNCIIKAWRNHYKQKTDIMLSINGIIKGLSIKMGSKNSVHIEPLSSFIKFLKENKIPKYIIDLYLKYHFADGTIDGKGDKRISSNEYKLAHENEIDLINLYFNSDELLNKVIDRFVTVGNNSQYSIDAICLGIPSDYIWITREDIVKILHYRLLLHSSGVHFSSLFCQPQTRNLNYNALYESKRYCVQIKWYSLYDDIVLNMYFKSLNYS